MHDEDDDRGAADGVRDGTSRLADELARFARNVVRTRSMLSVSDLGADFSALMLLFPLRAMGPMRVTDLAEIKQADASTVSRQAAQLVRAGLVQREADPEDGRASRLAITGTGLAACERLHDARVAMLGEALGHWPDERIALFAGLFEEFNTAVEAYQRTEPATATPLRETL